ncbi:Molybdopterin adenylyltransferase [Microbacterium hydrocarbonoxydans]|uniref:Molybdopterin adenylyltransferase n=1 Tax=Microbacterium hydrocarbonoxydans TaxID=273678 RepID=A0A0M2HMB4_9MICO|nr:MogA/MoaB family molybdenum cofactor biosynthesis protein [Microbacterium hydrocarbonoxydans]KJL47882.1 Molybdopterin adenylyltransferase [Microbacterium hydrocarbonoxydans]
MTRSARVLVVSTRAANGVYEDRTGPVIVGWLRERGFEVQIEVVTDAGVDAALGALLAEHPSVVLTTGGTGVSPDDRTPEATRALLDVELPGIIEEVRRRGAAVTPTAVLSRAVAGVAGETVVMNLPGSTGGVRDGLAVLDGVLDHLLDQLDGGDH